MSLMGATGRFRAVVSWFASLYPGVLTHQRGVEEEGVADQQRVEEEGALWTRQTPISSAKGAAEGNFLCVDKL